MTNNTQVTQFRKALYLTLPGRPDACTGLIRALAGNQGIQSVVAFCESELFRRAPASVGRAIAALWPRGRDQKGVHEVSRAGRSAGSRDVEGVNCGTFREETVRIMVGNSS